MSEVPAVSGRLELTREVDAAFADGGALAESIEQFEPRDGQRLMARRVAETLTGGGVLLAEAGTGTGKTLAYLVPAILSRHRVMVSTGTKNLQEQIYFKDLPVLQGALGVDFTATYMKGRANYLCLHRYGQAPPELVAELDAWVRTTETGDRAELEGLPDESAFWNDVSANVETCLGSDCPQFQDCFVTRMRQRAAASDIVIVNHHLLCADAAIRQNADSGAIPDCHHLVLDEAHQLEDVATQFFGRSLSNYRLDELVRDADRLLNAGVIADEDSEMRRAIAHVSDHARAFFGSVGMMLVRGAQARSADEPPRVGVRGDTRVRVGADWFGDDLDTALALVSALDGLEGAMALAGGKEEAGSKANEDALAIARRAGEIRDDLRFVLAAADVDHVYFIETRGRGVYLRAAPIDVSHIIHEQVFERMTAVVLTSATLSVGGRFDYVKGRLGIREAAEVAVPSEFDFTRQAILYLPRRMPAPRAPDFAEAVAREAIEILRRTEGRAFVLFTSYSVLNTVRGRIEGVLPYPLLVQGTAPRRALLQEFRSRPHAVLLATSSFWQGVDVVGEQLSCVIIDKLPFASPGDPITAARIEAISARGGDAFGDYQVPLAILALLQGMGRLIRHRTDRGVLAVLDPRLRTMAYGSRFLGSFPPAPVTSDLSAIERFFD